MSSQHHSFSTFNPRTFLLKYMVILLAISGTTLSAREALIISINSVDDRIHKQNPDLVAARMRIAEARGKLDQSGRLSNPVFGVATSQDPSFDEYSLNASIAQKFPVTNRLALAKAISEDSLKAAKAEILDVERRLKTQAKLLVIKILTHQKQRVLLKKQQSLADDFAEKLTSTAEQGEGSELDARHAKLEAAKYNQQLHQLRVQTLSLHGQLKPLLGMNIDEPLSVTGDLTGFQLSSRLIQTSKRPDLKAAQFHAAAASKSAELERAKSRDDIELTFTAGIERDEDAPEGYDSEERFGIGFRIPLPFWNKNKGAIHAAEARSERKHLELAALDHKIQHQASSAYSEMSEWAKIGQEISMKLLPMAREHAGLAEDAYRAGQGDIKSNLRAKQQVLSLSLAKLEALRDFHLAKARYQAAINQ